MKLKLVHPRKVVHVASAAFYAPKDSPSIKTSPRKCSFEGISLSVSNEPEYWADTLYGTEQIAYRLKRIDGSPASFAFYGHKIVHEAQHWALENGWAVEREGFETSSILPSSDSDLPMFFLSPPQWEDPKRIRKVTIAYPSDRFIVRYKKYFRGGKSDKSKTGSVDENDYLRDCVNVEYANLFLASQYPELDGIWMNGFFHGELPSGGILPPRFKAWHVDSIYKYR